MLVVYSAYAKVPLCLLACLIGIPKRSLSRSLLYNPRIPFWLVFLSYLNACPDLYGLLPYQSLRISLKGVIGLVLVFALSLLARSSCEEE